MSGGAPGWRAEPKGRAGLCGVGLAHQIPARKHPQKLRHFGHPKSPFRIAKSVAVETVERVLSGSLSPRTSRSEPRAPVERYGSAPRVSLSNVRCSARARCPGTNAADALDGVAHDVARTLRRRELSVRGDVDLRQAVEQIPCVVARLNGGPAPPKRPRRRERRRRTGATRR